MKRRLTMTVVALAALQLAVIAAVWLLARSALEAELRGVLLATLVFMLLLALAASARKLFEIYLVPLARLREELALLAANPAHRVTPQGAQDVRGLIGRINELAAVHQALHEQGQARIIEASRALAEEKNRLAALMAELAVGVLVCNLEGRILLYNKHARQLLDRSRDEPGGAGAAPFGLGRSLFGVIERGLVVHALEQIQHRLHKLEESRRAGAPEPAPAEMELASRFVASLAGGELVRARMAPVLDEAGGLNGFVLVLEDITREVETDSSRDALLLALTRDARAALANLRAALETMQAYPEMDGNRRVRFIEVIDEESQRLVQQVDRAQGEYGGALDRRREFEEMRAADLLALLQRRIDSPVLQVRLASAEREAGTGENDLWLAVDAYGLSLALADWCRRLVGKASVSSVELGMQRAGGLARIEISWAGAAPGADTLRDWEQAPLPAGGGVEANSLSAVLAHHGGESVYRYDAAGARSHYWLLLPASVPPHSLEITPRVQGRPEFYDFDLFQHAGLDMALEQTPLAQLSYTVFDTETTGLQPVAGDEIISIGAVRVVNGRLLQQEIFDCLIRPRCPLSAESVTIHGITEAMLAGQPRAEQVLPQFERFVEDTVLVAHNAAFDLRFLQMQEEQSGVRLRQPVLDTLLLSQVIHPNQAEHTLEAIAGRLGVAIVGRHTALGDAMVTAEVFLRMLPLLAGMGIRTLGEAREAERQTRYARLRY